MATNVPPMVATIIALRSSLPPVSDELRKRVQSIRVRSIPETSGHASNANDRSNWRNRGQNSYSPGAHGAHGAHGTHGTHSSNSAHGGNSGNWRQSQASSPRHQLPTRPPISRPPSFQNFQESSAASHQPLSPSGPPARYVSKFHNGSKVGDDQILNTVILNKLNVFSVKTYEDVKQFLFQILGSDQKEFIREFTWLVFRKAAAEDKFCGLFAKLLSEIKKDYPVILEEMKKLHTTYLDIWKVTDSKESQESAAPEGTSGQADPPVDRRCRLGYSQFLAELTALGVLDPETMRKTLETLKSCIVECLDKPEHAETVEEYMDCLRQLCGTRVPRELRKMIRELLVKDMESWIDMARESVPGLSSKSRFACMDLRDALRNS